MRNNWLNLVLLLTNRIYARKQLVIEEPGLKALGNIFILVFLEMILSIISLPLYLAMSSDKVIAYFAEKGSYEKVNFDYSLRRVLTITGVGIIAIIWALKLLLIFLYPAVYGPPQLYTVSTLQPVDILSQNLIAAETGIQTARNISSMPAPTITNVKKVKGENYSFFGKGQPDSTVVLLLSDVSSAVYTAVVDKNGDWQVDHQQNNFKLSEGNHSLLIFAYDPKLGVRSETAPEQFFKVTVSWYDYLVRNADSVANWSVAVIVLVGVFLILLTI